MSPTGTYDEPLIGPSEQALFGIKDTRERADTLRAKLTTKLKVILDEACDHLRAVYGTDALEPYSISQTPAHRKKAKETKAFDIASAGLTVKGVAWFLQQRFECSSSHLTTRVFGLRGLEANPLVTVLQRHVDEAARLIEHIGCSLWTASIGSDIDPDELTLPEYIRHFNIKPNSEWCGTGLDACEQELPVVDLDAAWANIYDFIALFQLYRAATNVILDRPDQFPKLVEMFWGWNEQITEGPDDVSVLEDLASGADVYREADELESAIEGEITLAIQRHRRRESRLRDAKIRQALREGHGRLICEVPGCGFDFFEVYGQIGRDFAIVHHKSPLSDRTEPKLTKLEDLAIVCANCHAMIHRGNDCRSLEELIRRRP
jgi:hypothetical protein